MEQLHYYRLEGYQKKPYLKNFHKQKNEQKRKFLHLQ